ncbi:lipoxygenase family protein [Dolichospermum sp. UHCC 0259]|uniref:lipoxygenase family protein n=1 Tax=Dolichospermum sp. UHCC 0259 TaxID=2590010 RepID=UPI0015803392|nr:lipoxygenase family protein [Dolichospermum sp. UHCC 0259]
MSKLKTILDELKQVLGIKVADSDLGKNKAIKKAQKGIIQIREQEFDKPLEQLHKATGKLVFSDTNKPVHNIQLELWDRDIGTPGDYLGRGATDYNGQFTIYYDPGKAGFIDQPDLELRLLESRIRFDSDNQPVATYRIVYTIKGGDNVTQKNYDFGTCTVPYWLYKPGSHFARLFFSELEGTPDDYSVGRTLLGYDAASGLVPIKAKHVITNTLHPDQPTLPEIQAAYPPNLTIKLDRKNPGYTRSDEYFVLRVINGMNPCLLKRNKQNPNLFKTGFNWDNYEKDNDHDLNNVEAFLELKENKLVVTAITVQSRYPDSLAPHSPLKDAVTYTPNDGEKWLQAKRIFRTNSFFAAEMIEHYIKAHLQMEQYTIAAFRNLRKNPVRLMLFPHVKSLVNINQRADEVLVSPTVGLVTTNGPLTPGSVVQVCKERMASYDWKGWKPRQPLFEGHTFAKIANLYWQVLTEYIDSFFQDYQEDIIKEWAEIHRLSDDIVEHSVAYQPLAVSDDGDYDWYDHNELDHPEIPRTTVNGTVKATRAITTSDQPSATDIENLKELCRYVIFHLTFWHSWVNDAQADEGGEIFYNSLALRGGSFGSEDDPAIAPNVLESTNLIYMVNVLTAIKYGYILKNEDDDIPEELRKILAGYKKQFADLDYEVSNIRALINV